MRRISVAVLPVVAALSLLMGASMVFAGETLLVRDADVPYAFLAAGKTMPAGHYEVLVSDDANANYLVLKDKATGKSTVVQYTTRSASRRDGQDVVVFDVEGGQHLLSEIHLANADGYLLPAAKGKHTHVEVRASKG